MKNESLDWARDDKRRCLSDRIFNRIQITVCDFKGITGYVIMEQDLHVQGSVKGGGSPLLAIPAIVLPVVIAVVQVLVLHVNRECHRGQNLCFYESGGAFGDIVLVGVDFDIASGNVDSGYFCQLEPGIIQGFVVQHFVYLCMDLFLKTLILVV